MVSQSQDGVGWEGSGSPSRTGSLLSLDGRQRPPPAKTPPSYYDAVRSRHSLSQPRPSETTGKDVKSTNGQQVKYNSLPRPLPQRYPPTLTNANGQQHRPWPEDYYDSTRSTSNTPWRTGDLPQPPRQLYESPPKPANHVPLQLRVHNQDNRYIVKRSPEQTESCSAPGPRSNEQQRLNGSLRADRLTADCSARGNSADIPRKNSFRSLPMPLDGRSPPIPSGRTVHPRSPSIKEQNSNSLPRRDQNFSSDIRRYTLTPDGSPIAHPNYPPRPAVNGSSNYEPRYSKSGKLTRPLSQGFESRPMPPPVVQLRTGPLGSYPDPETLKRAEYSSLNRSYDERHVPRTPSHSDISQQIYVDTTPHTNGKTVVTDHLAIPYRIPQVSPKNACPSFNGCNGDGQKQQLTTCPRSVENHNKPRRFQDTKSLQYNGNAQTYSNQQAPFRGISDDNAIYANHSSSLADQRFGQKSTNGNGASYDKQPPKSFREIQDTSHDDTNVLYANQHMTSARYKPTSHNGQQEDVHSPSAFQKDRESTMPNFRSSQKSYPPGPVVSKHRPTLPQPSEMVMITETRGWNGQANSYPKDLVKPTPRLPRFANIASGTQLSSVPAYQCVINELSSQNVQQSSLPHSSDSSTLSLRSGYDSSNSSVRDFGRQPSKSDSSLDLRKSSEGGLKTASSQQCIDKTFLSASMTSLCSDTSSSISTRRYRYHYEDPNWDRMNEEFRKRKDKGSVFSASPWEREEKEKMQQEQLLDARRVRDNEIAMLEAIPDRNEKQEEWLRILRLEREFQRRAEQEMNEDDEEEDEEETDKSLTVHERNDKVEIFHGDKVNAIPNERLGLKLLDQLLEDSSKSSILESNREFSKSPSEKHFIPLELTIPDRDLLQSSALPVGSNILQVSDPKNAELSNNRLSKPPIPAPRPSKAPVTYKSELNIGDLHHGKLEEEVFQLSQDKVAESNLHSLSKLEISNGNVYYNESSNPSRDYLQDNWMIEVNSFDSKPATDILNNSINKQTDDHKEELRIYENITEFPTAKHQNQSQNMYVAHTLPKVGNTTLKDATTVRSGGAHFEKKFPAMGVSSTLSRKLNGHIPCDADILPALYASSKVKTIYRKEIPTDLEDKSPEFKKIWVSRPEKLTFQDKIRKFSLQAGEDDPPRDRVKNSRAQREIETKFSDGQRKVVINQEMSHV